MIDDDIRITVRTYGRKILMSALITKLAEAIRNKAATVASLILRR